ncbi:MAG: hypothetical protein MR360_09390, partial [Ruminococcus sp.]
PIPFFVFLIRFYNTIPVKPLSASVLASIESAVMGTTVASTVATTTATVAATASKGIALKVTAGIVAGVVAVSGGVIGGKNYMIIIRIIMPQSHQQQLHRLCQLQYIRIMNCQMMI